MTDAHAPDTLEALLTHTEWVRALAQRLVHPEHDADDVVQETWVAVLERPPRPGGNVRGWLATVVRNVVRARRRADTRRRRREEIGARAEAEADTTSVVERAEIHRRLVNTVMKMREPYRTAVLLRFFEGLAPREIAAKLGVPAETARSRVQRGVAVLRAQLDDAWGDRAAWVAVLTPLLQAPVALTASTGGGAVVATGGALLSAPAKVALGGVVLAAAVGGAVIAPSLFDADSRDVPPESPPQAVVVSEVKPPQPNRGGTGRPVDREPPPPSRPKKPLQVTLPPQQPPQQPPSQAKSPGDVASAPARPREEAGPRPWPMGRSTRTEPTAAPVPVPARLEREVEPMARLFSDYEKWDQKGRPGNQARAWKQIEKRMASLRRKGHELLAIPAFWTAVFTHPKYRRFPGRSGKKRNQKLEFNKMGRAMRVNWHADVPRAYRAETSMALVLGLSDTRGNFHAKQLLGRLWSPSKLDTVIVVAPEFPRTLVRTRNACWSDRRLLWASMGVLGQMARAYNVAFDGLFLDGGGEGAADVWRIASCFADTYAGFIIRGAPPPEGTRLEDFRHNAFLLVGIEGSGLNLKQAMKLNRKMRALGIDVSVAGQDTATGAGRRIRPPNGRDPLASFVQKRRPHYPLELDWSVKSGNTRRHFWVRSTLEIEDEAIAVAAARKTRPNFQVKADRKQNRLIVTTHRILGLKIRLNDAILDLDREVVVEVNGKQLCRQRLSRDLRQLYQIVYSGGDPTRIFPAEICVEIPAHQ